MNIVEITNLGFSYADQVVISDVSFSIERGQIISLVGPSGCGKSTFLRLISGLEDPAEGIIKISTDTKINDCNFLRFLFQDYDAFPWHTVSKNVQYGSGEPPYPSSDAVNEMLLSVGLGTEKNKYPGELSGGMRKRLALARCLVRHPKLLLLDEPFSSLDIDSRFEMYCLVQRLWAESGCSVILVTHDIAEAVFLADRVIVASHRPLFIKEDIEIKLNRPRLETTLETDDFICLVRHISGMIRKPVQ